MTSLSDKMKRPKWSLTTHFWAAIFIIAIASACVFLISRRNIWIELEIIVGVLSIISLLYFYFILYFGVRFNKNDRYIPDWKELALTPWREFSGNNTGESSTGTEAWPVYCLFDSLLSLAPSFALTLLVAILFWLGAYITIIGIPILFFPLYFLFARSLRFIVAKGRSCHKTFGRSLKYALGATVVSMTWLYLIIFTGHHISKWLYK